MKQSKLQLLKNIAKSASRPARIPTMVKMVLKEQGFDTRGSLSEDENLSWLKENVVDFAPIARESSPDLWQETESFFNEFKPRAERIVKEAEHKLGYPLGGGGYYPFLYFVTRKLQPECVVETGVATGFSSHAFLKAISINAKGHLFSSDFPYFRVRDPESYIGIVVDEELKKNWTLMIEGDEVNLPRILEVCNKIDVFHYDSDKSYNGRAWAMSHIEERSNIETLTIMDDVQDNSFFHDYVRDRGRNEWMIFAFEGKFVGLVGATSRLIG